MCKTGVTAAQASHPQKTTENGLMMRYSDTHASDKSIQPFNIKKHQFCCSTYLLDLLIRVYIKKLKM